MQNLKEIMNPSQILENLKRIKRKRIRKLFIKLKFNEKQSKADLLVLTLQMNSWLNSYKQNTVKNRTFYEVQSGNKAIINIQAQSAKQSNKSTKIDIAHIKAQSTILNPSFTFDSFVVGILTNTLMEHVKL